MSAGNQNKFGLDELEFIPGEVPFEKVSAWNKLQDRMGEKKTKKNYWYLTAASILIVLSAGVFTWNYERRNNIGKNGSNSIISAKSNPKDSSKINPLLIEQKISSQKNIIGSSSIAGKNKSASKKTYSYKVFADQKSPEKDINNLPSTLHVEPLPILTRSSTPDVINSIPVEVLQNQTAAQLQPVKKKLKVLHHNQLQNTHPVTNPAYSARSGNLQGTTVFGRNKSDDVIKIKITSPN